MGRQAQETQEQPAAPVLKKMHTQGVGTTSSYTFADVSVQVTSLAHRKSAWVQATAGPGTTPSASDGYGSLFMSASPVGTPFRRNDFPRTPPSRISFSPDVGQRRVSLDTPSEDCEQTPKDDGGLDGTAKPPTLRPDILAEMQDLDRWRQAMTDVQMADRIARKAKADHIKLLSTLSQPVASPRPAARGGLAKVPLANKERSVRLVGSQSVELKKTRRL
jgi:hypothetical protein